MLWHTQIKTGAPCRSERLAKYNQILRWALLNSQVLSCFSEMSIKSVKHEQVL